MIHVLTERFIQVYENLLSSHEIRSARQFAAKLECLPQSLHPILKGRRDISLELLEKVVRCFPVRAEYLFTGKGPMLVNEISTKEIQVLAVITDYTNNEKIVHVPLPAHAGYAAQYADVEYINSLPRYSLPQFDLLPDCSLRSFEVCGESMMPTLFDNDIIISSYLHRINWQSKINSADIFVVIHNNGIVVKRLTNRLREEQCILLHSDNSDFSSYSMHISEVKEIWKVEAKISTRLQKPESVLSESEQGFGQLRNAIEKQVSLLEKIADKMDIN